MYTNNIVFGNQLWEDKVGNSRRQQSLQGSGDEYKWMHDADIVI